MYDLVVNEWNADVLSLASGERGHARALWEPSLCFGEHKCGSGAGHCADFTATFGSLAERRSEALSTVPSDPGVQCNWKQILKVQQKKEEPRRRRCTLVNNGTSCNSTLLQLWLMVGVGGSRLLSSQSRSP
jgi:hypothetical protein